jgi:uncharacterized protein (DUF342 family)
MAVIAKGNAVIVLNADETEAKLVFTPDAEGLGWDPDAIIKLAGEQRLAPAPSPKALEPFLQKAAKAKTKDPMELTLYQGQPAEAPEGEKIAWEALPVPGDIAVFREETLSGAPPPELYRIRVEKIKKETVVKKPAPLPFLPPKEEKVVTWEKKETKERAEVNAGVTDVRYAAKNQKLGTVSPPRPGKPGKNVFNRSIPPPAQGDGAFLLGRGIVRSKNDLHALYGGFLRIGGNWADMVPLAKHRWSVDRGADGVTVFFQFEPGDRRFTPPKGAEVLAAALEKGAPQALLVPAEAVDGAVGESLAAGEAVEAFSLLQVQEAMAKVETSPDRMEAVLQLRKGLAGGIPLEMKMIGQALRDSGVQGIDMEKLRADIKSFMEGKETELLNYPLAQGKASTRGKDRELEIAVTFLEEAGAAPILDRLKKAGAAGAAALGEFSLEEVTGLAPVEKDARIARMGPAAAGEPGKDVFGTVLPGLPGNDPELKLFQGIAQHGADITASQGGLLLVRAAERSFQAAVIEYRDARAVVTVSEDAMTARGDLFAAAGAGFPLTPETVMKALAAAGVVKGIDKGALENAVKAANEKGRCMGTMLARGEPPLAKNVPHIRWLVPIEPGLLPAAPASAESAGDKNAAEKTPPPGNKPASAPVSVEAAVAAVAAKAKIAELPVKIQTMQVNAGTPLAEIHPGDPEGRPGWDLRGAALGPERGIAVPLNHDDSVTETPAGNGVRLGAARSGTLHYDGKDLKISSLKGIKGDVGKATGNISFPGELRIQGSVASGFSVMAGLNVLIGGGVESSLVSAGGKAVIAGGVRGAGKGVVRARSTIETAFVEEATLMAVDDIRVAKGCSRCNIKTNGRLLITGETGKLAGGVCRARRGVEVQELGSEKGNQTEISFGQDYLVKDQIEMLEGELAKVNAALKRIEERIAAAADPAVLNAARAEKVGGLKMREQLSMKLFTLREKFEVHHESELRVRGPVHPGVVMESHGRYYEVNRRRTGVVFYFDRATGRIMERGL